MKKKTLNELLIEEMKLRIPNNSELMNKLCDILDMSKEAIYRRMRGEVQFSLEEASIISEKTGLSLDSLSGISSLKRPFVFKISDFANPQGMDYKLINETVELLGKIKDNPDTEIGISAKLIPDGIHLNYPYITRFYLFQWIYQYDNTNHRKKYGEVKGTDKVLEILTHMAYLLQHIKKTYYIFDKRIFENMVEDIKYFNSIGLISHDDIQLLKVDLYACLDDLEQQASTGLNRLGNKIEIYLSNINFEAGFSYIKSENYKISTVRSFTFYDITSNDTIVFEKSLKWIQSLKWASMMISESAEIARINFFAKQREVVSTL